MPIALKRATSLVRHARAPTKRTKLSTKSSYTRTPRRQVQEIKRVQFEFIPANSSPTAAGGAIFALPRITAGDNDDERNGRSVKVLGFQARVYYLPSVAVDEHILRVIYFTWKQALTAPSVGDILDSTGVGPILGTYNVTQANNYAILSDRTYHANSPGPGLAALWTQNPQIINAEMNVNFIQNYADLTAGSNQDKHIFCLIATQVDGELFQGNAAVSFTDI